MPVSRPPATSGPCQSGTTQSGDSSELAARLPCKGKSVRNRGVSQTMPFLVIPRSLLRGGFITTALRALFSVHRLTIYHWVDAWEAHHCAGLYDQKRCGRPPKLTAEDQDQAQHSLTQHPSESSKGVHRVEQATSKRVSATTIKRLVKKTALSGNASQKLRRSCCASAWSRWVWAWPAAALGEGGAARSTPGARGRGTPRISAGTRCEGAGGLQHGGTTRER